MLKGDNYRMQVVEEREGDNYRMQVLEVEEGDNLKLVLYYSVREDLILHRLINSLLFFCGLKGSSAF